MQITVHTDGGARGNPGPAGVGVVIEYEDERKLLKGFIGQATNNQAEYQAVIKALAWIKENIKDDVTSIDFLLDSQLIVEQLNQRYKLKNEGLKPLFWEIRDLIMALGGNASFKYIPREENKLADKLVNEAIDEGVK